MLKSGPVHSEFYQQPSMFQANRAISQLRFNHLKTKKSRIRETKHLLTDEDSSTDTTVGWTKNTQKPK